MCAIIVNADNVYLDNNATTAVDSRVLDAMLPYFSEQYGNPASLHQFGAGVAARIDEAHASIAAAIGARESEIVISSGGTEADNLAMRGVMVSRPGRKRVVISAIEHHAILEPADQLAREGFDVVRIGVDGCGRLDMQALEVACTPQTALVSIMLANNETGVQMPVSEAARIAKRVGAVVHTDAVNALGKVSIKVDELGVDLLSISAHKIHGPKGVGALYVRRGTPLRPQILGGPQERQRRGGTSNVAGIVGLATACEMLKPADNERVAELRDHLEREIESRCARVRIIGRESPRVCNTSCMCFEGAAAEPILLLLSEAGICASSGAACSSGSLEPSHVLAAMGIAPEIAQGQVRFSLSRFTTDAEVGRVIEVLPSIVERVAAVRTL